jgi:two-component system alkaline phosphatase synthesis response regulator PhoP
MEDSSNNKTILVVEDDNTLNNALVLKLKQQGYNVKPAFDGLGALDILKKEYVDVILLDMLMPKLDGLGFLEKLAEENVVFKGKIIILTNFEPNDSISIKGKQFEPFYYLTKAECSLEEITMKIEEAFKVLANDNKPVDAPTENA